jgi:hypothetical protein
LGVKNNNIGETVAVLTDLVGELAKTKEGDAGKVATDDPEPAKDPEHKKPRKILFN